MERIKLFQRFVLTFLISWNLFVLLNSTVLPIFKSFFVSLIFAVLISGIFYLILFGLWYKNEKKKLQGQNHNKFR